MISIEKPRLPQNTAALKSTEDFHSSSNEASIPASTVREGLAGVSTRAPSKGKASALRNKSGLELLSSDKSPREVEPMAIQNHLEPTAGAIHHEGEGLGYHQDGERYQSLAFVKPGSGEAPVQLIGLKRPRDDKFEVFNVSGPEHVSLGQVNVVKDGAGHDMAAELRAQGGGFFKKKEYELKDGTPCDKYGNPLASSSRSSRRTEPAYQQSSSSSSGVPAPMLSIQDPMSSYYQPRPQPTYYPSSTSSTYPSTPASTGLWIHDPSSKYYQGSPAPSGGQTSGSQRYQLEDGTPCDKYGQPLATQPVAGPSRPSGTSSQKDALYYQPVAPRTQTRMADCWYPAITMVLRGKYGDNFKPVGEAVRKARGLVVFGKGLAFDSPTGQQVMEDNGLIPVGDKLEIGSTRSVQRMLDQYGPFLVSGTYDITHLGHAVVVIGVDHARQMVCIQDPAQASATPRWHEINYLEHTYRTDGSDNVDLFSAIAANPNR